MGRLVDLLEQDSEVRRPWHPAGQAYQSPQLHVVQMLVAVLPTSITQLLEVRSRIRFCSVFNV